MLRKRMIASKHWRRFVPRTHSFRSRETERSEEGHWQRGWHSQVRLRHFLIPLSKFLRRFHITRNRKSVVNIWRISTQASGCRFQRRQKHHLAILLLCSPPNQSKATTTPTEAQGYLVLYRTKMTMSFPKLDTGAPDLFIVEGSWDHHRPWPLHAQIVTKITGLKVPNILI